MRIDLHMHSNYSDGILPVKKMIHILVSFGVKTFSITDHDTVEATEEAINESKKSGIECIPGIEISSEHNNREIHILGYYIDYKNKELINELYYFKEKRLSRADHILEKLRLKGIDIERNLLDQYSENGVLGRPHIADILVEKGIVSSRKEAFKKYLGFGSVAYVPREKVQIEQAISLIINAGGIPVLAHPGLSLQHKDLDHILSAGILGIEVFHPDHNLTLTDYYYNFAINNNLLITGGTDWHGDKHYGLYHPFKIPYENILKMKQHKRSNLDPIFQNC